MKIAPIRVGINALFLLPGQVGGTEVYLRGLAAELAGLPEVESLVIFTNRENHALFAGDISSLGSSGEKVRLFATGIPGSRRGIRAIYEQTILPLAAWRAKVDVLHSPGYVAPLLFARRGAVTVCDLNYRAHPEDFSFPARLAQAILVPLSARFSRVVCTLTESIKAELIRELGLKEAKIFTTPCGVGAEFGSIPGDRDFSAFQAAYDLPDRYILAVSASHPHKNLEGLLKAFALLSREKSVDFGLAITGSSGRSREKVFATIRQLGLEDKVRILGWIDDREMPMLYSHALCLVFPSLYEGFGIPLIEAFAARLPVAASDIPVVREVAGRAARFFNPLKPEEIARAIDEVCGNPAIRAQMIAAGVKRAERYTLENSARAALAAYGRILESAGPRRR